MSSGHQQTDLQPTGRGAGAGGVEPNVRVVNPSKKSEVSMSDAIPTVFVVDDDVSVRQSLESLITAEGWVPQAFASAQEFLSRPRVLALSCLLLDVNLPDLDGLALQERIADDRICMPIIFITGYGDVPITVRAMKAGAVEFLTKPLSVDVLLSAIRDALDRSRAALGDAAEACALRGRFASLTGREREVMTLVVAGRLNKQVGWDLGISEITVKAHRGNMIRKMKADSLPDLVKMSARLGLGDGPDSRKVSGELTSSRRAG